MDLNDRTKISGKKGGKEGFYFQFGKWDFVSHFD